MEINNQNYKIDYIGTSRESILLFRGVTRNSSVRDVPVEFGKSGRYEAYFVNHYADIPSDYQLVAEFNGKVQIYDDCKMTLEFSADVIKIYRFGDTGCVIQLIDNRIAGKDNKG